jgi:hypothetical protein
MAEKASRESVDLMNQLQEAAACFRETEYNYLITQANACWQVCNWDGVRECLAKLPSSKQLLDELMAKLKGKSIYKTFERIGKGESSDIQQLKSISSLLTHVVIEIEQGHREYRKLIPTLLEKINSISWNVMS